MSTQRQCPLVRRLLIATRGPERPTVALEVALRLARTLRLQLHVLRVLPGRVGLSVLDASGAGSFGAPGWADSVRKETSAWVSGVISTGLPEDQVQVRTGRFEDMVAAEATALAPDIIVVSDAGRADGAALQIVRVTDTPVLVARSLNACREIVVAATNLKRPEYPVVRRACAVAEQLGSSLIAVHNVHPRETISASGIVWPVSAPVVIDSADAAARRLDRLRGQFDAPVQTVLSQESDASDAILRAADLSNAQLIVVGARRRSWLHRLLRRGVAHQLIERSQRCVLVCPVGDEARRAGPPAEV